jgi:predicted Zn finger-like uncharacterized protein
MNVSCPECRSIFRIDPAKITSISMRARCSVCGGLIAVGAAVQWEDDLPGAPVSAVTRGAREPVGAGAPSMGAPMQSTPAGVKPVLARTPAPASPSTPAAARPAPAASAAPPQPSQPRRSWGTPAAVPRVPGPGPSTRKDESSGSESGNEGRRGAPQVTAPARGAQPARQTPTYNTLDSGFDSGVDPLAATPRHLEVMGGAAASVPAPPAGAPPARGASTFGAPLTPPARTTIPAPAAQSPQPAAAPTAPFPARSDAAAAFSTRSTPASPPAAVPSQRRPINPFLANDPNQKARRLARALVSDMVAYHPTKREEGIEHGTLKQLFRDEIKKSYEEYVEQVGRDFAETTAHFQEALNDVLAGGRKIF